MLIAYLTERLPARLALPVSALLALAAATRGWPGGPAFAGDAGFALLLFAQFRLWDDLADRRRDCLAHPKRTLCRSASTAPVAAACVTLAVANAGLAVYRAGVWSGLTALIGLHALIGAQYLLRRSRTAAGDHLLLAKYPAFVFIIAAPAGATVTLLATIAATYLGACLYEGWHDPASPLSRNRPLVVSEAALLLAALAVLFSAHLSGGHA